MDFPLGQPSYQRRLSNQRYDYRQAIHIQDVITNEFVESLNLIPGFLDQKFNRGKRIQRQFTRKVFLHGIKVILETCIATNKRFVSPTVPSYSIFISPKSPAEVRGILKRKEIYKDLDLFESDFKVYEFVLFHPNSDEKYNKVRIGYTLYKQLETAVNNGMKYQSLGQFSINYVATELVKHYPTIDYEMISRILRQGFYRMNTFVMKGEEIYFKSIPLFLQFTMYHNLKATR